jgi:hypothetical protein
MGKLTLQNSAKFIGWEHPMLHYIKRQAYIIEDDYDGEFRYFGKPIPSLQGLIRLVQVGFLNNRPVQPILVGYYGHGVVKGFINYVI